MEIQPLTRRALFLMGAGAGLAFAGAEALPKTELVQPQDLAATLKKTKPMVVCVAFPFLYKGAHIEGAVYGGAGSKPEGIATLTALMKDVPKDREIVLYCGCCPWDHCPNIQPAFEALKSAGFKRVKALVIATNLHTDWVTKGYPTTKPAA
jgi:rhodanese-related sulfurtransferase